MKHQLGKITARDTAQALKAAEAQLERPEATNGRPLYVEVYPQDIKERLELFQPRRPGWGTRTLETSYVNKLAARITRKGELDPVLVVKLGNEWVIVDGHHRIAAYRKLKHPLPIKCEWFSGTAREAMDEGLKRSEKTHLEMQQGDKAEAAWTRTLLDWRGDNKWSKSKADVVGLTGCGEGSVAQMRRTLRWHHDQRTGGKQTPMGEKLLNILGTDLRKHSWNKVKEVLLGLTVKERDTNDAAARLASNLYTRMTNKLAENPEVTARALWLYDKDMCRGLVEALPRLMEEKDKEEKDLDREANEEALRGQD